MNKYSDISSRLKSSTSASSFPDVYASSSRLYTEPQKDLSPREEIKTPTYHDIGRERFSYRLKSPGISSISMAQNMGWERFQCRSWNMGSDS